MGLFKKASVVMTPNGVKAGKVFSVKPANGDGDFTFTRYTAAGIAHRESSDGLLKSVASGVPRLDYSDGVCPALLLEPQSTNLVTYPLSFISNYWVKSKASIEGDTNAAEVEVVVDGNFPEDTIVWPTTVGTDVYEGYAHIISDGAWQYVRQLNAMEVGKSYVVSYEILPNEVGYGTLKMANSFGISPIASTVGVHSFKAVALSTTLSFDRSLACNIKLANISVKEVQGFVSPDGTTNSYKLVPSVAAGSSYISLTASTGLKTNSFFLKKGELSYVSVGNAAYVVVVDLILGALSKSSDSINNYSIEKHPNGWYRVSIYNKTASNYQIQLFTGVDSNGVNITNNGTSGVYIYGAQLEALPYATSLMLPAVEGSTVTRVADSCTNSGTPSDFGSAEGVLYAEIANITNGQDSRISISDGTLSNRASFAFAPTANEAYCLVRFNGVQVIQNLNLDLGFSQTNFTKVAVKYKSGQSSLFVNGVKVISSSVTFSPTSSDFTLSISGATGVPFYGKVRGVQVYKEALTDTELYDLTKPLYSTFDVMTNDLQYDTI